MNRFLGDGTESEPEDVGYEDEVDYDAEYDVDGDGYLDSAYPEAQVPPTDRRPGAWIKNLIAITISLAVLIGGGYFVVTKAGEWVRTLTASGEDYPGPGETEVIVEIPAGSTITQMGDILVSHDVVASAEAFLTAARENPSASSIQSGSYRLMTKMKASDAVAALVDRTNQVLNQVTIPEGLRNSLVLDRLVAGTGIPAEQFQAVLDNPAALGLPEWAGTATEGFLFPNTYEYDVTPTADEILVQMTGQFNVVAGELDFANRAAALGISPYDAVTVASIIEKETRDPKYGPDIAQVLYNRLRAGMKLQLDSTVIYAVNSPGTVTTTDEERANPSPYNTYVHEGLPPGAISNPGRNSLSSAVNPTTGDYLYFVATNPLDGTTKFAATWEEHEQNVAEFQQWCRDNPDHCTGG